MGEGKSEIPTLCILEGFEKLVNPKKLKYPLPAQTWVILKDRKLCVGYTPKEIPIVRTPELDTQELFACQSVKPWNMTNRLGKDKGIRVAPRDICLVSKKDVDPNKLITTLQKSS